ncbi:hypothetical protein [Streptomyces erythrochromogenes]|uniref:hypothetical protein n=1 Tax=Streptomyces erythrochromogenes TaxID=285574 RepID=UPI0038109F87
MADRIEVVVHPVGPSGGRAVTVHAHGQDTALGTAYGIRDLTEFLRAAGLEDAEALVDSRDPLIRWQRDGPDVWTRENG